MMTVTFPRLTGLLMLLGAVLAGCSNSGQKNPLQITAGQIAQRLGKGTEPVDARNVLTPAIVAQSTGSILLAVQLKVDAAFTLRPKAANRGTVQWEAANGSALLQRNGILVGTRGFGFDLMTADIEPLAAALVAGGGRDLLRVHRILAGGEMVVTNYFCDLTAQGSETLTYYGRAFPTRAYRESCRSEAGETFENLYWVSPNGTVRRSVERVSPEIGRFDLVRLTE